MAAVRRGQAQMTVALPKSNMSNHDSPPISALFLIHFDIKAGYTIAWKRALPGVELEGVVEYKSLPSGLHTVQEDVIYFVHGQYAGVSVFASAPADEESRNARMIAVGVLVPLSYGRLGRSWLHVAKLKEMSLVSVADPSKTTRLEEYWNSHKADENGGAQISDDATVSPTSTRHLPSSRPMGHLRQRSASDGTVLVPSEQRLSEYHPAQSLTALLETFGPLIFPIHRAALLRKRILIAGHAPVQQACDFVYNISVLSNIPVASIDVLGESAPTQRLRPLFSIGVHDIPFLEEDLRISKSMSAHHANTEEVGEAGQGWIATTTDDILTMKDSLYDVLITLPPSHYVHAGTRMWPKVESPRGTSLRATQRDLRRYRALQWGLSRVAEEADSPALSRTTSAETGHSSPAEEASPSNYLAQNSASLDTLETDAVVEPLSWTALAYTGFMWWASAGERRLSSEDEDEHDTIFLDGFGPDPQTPRSTRSHSDASFVRILHGIDSSAKKEMAIIAYFHRLTTRLLITISDIIDSTIPDYEDEEADGEGAPLRTAGSGGGLDDDRPAIFVASADITKMGLDEWSSSDHAFIAALTQAYFGREAHIEGMGIDICGIRVC